MLPFRSVPRCLLRNGIGNEVLLHVCLVWTMLKIVLRVALLKNLLIVVETGISRNIPYHASSTSLIHEYFASICLEFLWSEVSGGELAFLGFSYAISSFLLSQISSGIPLLRAASEVLCRHKFGFIQLCCIFFYLGKLHLNLM